jgi:hypothetical protein
VIRALLAIAASLCLAVYALGYTDSDRCHEPMSELQETMLIDRPGCAR